MEPYLNSAFFAMVALLAWFVKTKMNSYDKKHDQHFESIRGIETSAATVVQQLKDHEKVDDERFGRIEEMSKEIRGDIKELLKRSSGDLRP